jgi:hypothetical protein
LDFYHCFIGQNPDDIENNPAETQQLIAIILGCSSAICKNWQVIRLEAAGNQ